MSYEPTLIISYEDLVRVNKKQHFAFDPKTPVEKFLSEIYNYNEKNHCIPTLKGVEMIVCQPEFTSFNKDVRDWLNENEVEFTIDY